MMPDTLVENTVSIREDRTPHIDREARRLYMKEYRKRPYTKEARHRSYVAYYGRPEVKEHRRKYWQRPEVKKRRHLYRRLHRVKRHAHLHSIEYRQRPEVRLLRRAMNAGHRAKGFFPLCPNVWSCPVDYHHVSPAHPYVVPLPRTVHHAVTGNSPFHFAFNASMICLLYGLDILGGL